MSTKDPVNWMLSEAIDFTGPRRTATPAILQPRARRSRVGVSHRRAGDRQGVPVCRPARRRSQQGRIEKTERLSSGTGAARRTANARHFTVESRRAGSNAASYCRRGVTPSAASPCKRTIALRLAKLCVRMVMPTVNEEPTSTPSPATAHAESGAFLQRCPIIVPVRNTVRLRGPLPPLPSAGRNRSPPPNRRCATSG